MAESLGLALTECQAQLQTAQAEVERLRAPMQRFIDRWEDDMVSPQATYEEFKRVLSTPLPPNAVSELVDGTSLFASFMQFVDAGREVDGEEPIKDDAIIVNYSGPGAGIFITAGDFRKLSKLRAPFTGEKP